MKAIPSPAGLLAPILFIALPVLRPASAERSPVEVPINRPVTFDGSIDKSAAKLADELGLNDAQQKQLRALMRQRAERVGRLIAANGKNFADGLRPVLTPAQLRRVDARAVQRQSADDLAAQLGDLTAEQKARIEELVRTRRKETMSGIAAPKEPTPPPWSRSCRRSAGANSRISKPRIRCSAFPTVRH